MEIRIWILQLLKLRGKYIYGNWSISDHQRIRVARKVVNQELNQVADLEVRQVMDRFSKLFNKASFFYIKKDQELSIDLNDLSERIILPQETQRFHPNRLNEFILGRVCAAKAYEVSMGTQLLSLPSLPSRAPQWPSGVVGSISHDQNFIAAAVASKKDLLAIGIDFEVIARTKPELSSRICNEQDLKTHAELNDAELLTVIFSAKESLYKALHPLVNMFFGFEAAVVREINLQNNTFIIDLLEPLTARFSPDNQFRFQGKFILEQGSCLTVIEIVD